MVIEQGPAGLTHRSVAIKGGIPLGTITRHFASIDVLRNAALQALADEMELSLDGVREQLSGGDDLSEALAELLYDFLVDPRQVHSWMALVVASTQDPSLRSLSARWSSRVLEILSTRTTPSRAEAIETYLNGAVMHAAMHDHPLAKEELARTLRAILETADGDGMRSRS